MSRPTVVCPVCGSADGVVLSIAAGGGGVVRRCVCGHQFDVDTSVPVPVPAVAPATSTALADLERDAEAEVAAADRAAFSLGALSVYVERAVTALLEADRLAEAAELDAAMQSARRVAFGPVPLEVVAS